MTSFEIVAGSYEEFLLGYVFNSFDATLKPSFASHDHSASIRCVAISDKYMASGAADDRIIIYDLKTRKEHCMLTQHDATVNCLQFTKNHSHIMSGSADGILSIVRTGNWQLEKVWAKAHKGQAILDIALHSSGKMALTLGADCCLITWNLVKGRRAFIVNLNSHSKDAKSLEKILWASDGVKFILYGGKQTEIWSIETGGILKVIDHSTRITSCMWFSSDQILAGYEDGKLCMININKLSRQSYDGHNGRIKSLLKHKSFVISASSDGEIKVWNENLEELSNVKTGCRLTCLSIISVVELKKEKEEDGVKDTDEVQTDRSIKKSTVVVEIDSDDELSDVMDRNKRELSEKDPKKKRKSKKVPDSHNKHLKNKKRKSELDGINEDFVSEVNTEDTKYQYDNSFINDLNHNSNDKRNKVLGTISLDDTPEEVTRNSCKAVEKHNRKKKRKTVVPDAIAKRASEPSMKKKKLQLTL